MTPDQAIALAVVLCGPVALVALSVGVVRWWRSQQAAPRPAAWVDGDLAMWCLDCDAIHDGTACPRCGSRQTWPVKTWLDREAA